MEDNRGKFKFVLQWILSYFQYVWPRKKNTFKLKENSVKIVVYQERKTPQIIINRKGTRMVQDGED